MDPLSLLKAKKEELDKTRPPPAQGAASSASAPAPTSAVGSLFADDVDAALSMRRLPGVAPPPPPSAFLGAGYPVDDPFRPIAMPALAAAPPWSPLGTAMVTDDPFRLGLPEIDKSGEDARAALNDFSKAAGAAFASIGGFLREKAGPSLASAAQAHSASLGHRSASSGGPGAGGGGGGGTGGLASLAAARGGRAPSEAHAGTTFEGMLLGEQVSVKVGNCFLHVRNPLCDLGGRLLATNYRLKFQISKGTLPDRLRWMREASYFDVAMGMIEDLKQEVVTSEAGATMYSLRIATKDLRVVELLLPSEEECRSVEDAVAAYGVPGNTSLLFAFKHAETLRGSKTAMPEFDGWRLYDPEQEYSRMGVETERLSIAASPWRLSQVNTDYSLCSTYPAKLVLPRRMADAELRAVAGFRKRGRLPAMSWCGGPELNFASLWRCSQTTEGLMGQKCREDQKMVELIRVGAGNRTDRDLLVIDLRPWKAAWANKAGGGGFEGYPKCNLIFGGIDNIHAVRDAWKAMGRAVASVTDGEAGTWFKDMANSCWYDYIGAILSSTLKAIVEITSLQSSVMVHCSDGWDRTAQVTSLSMLCLDHAYRTQSGFLRLVQKEWCSFGHRFRTRMALGEPATGEFCPVFIQWLECVYQIVRQTPDEFEFSTDVLLRLANEVASNRYGTFLCDNEYERQQMVAPFAISLWSVLLRPEDMPSWRNDSYRPSQRALVPVVCQANYGIWEEYWWRYHPRAQNMTKARPAQPFGLASGAAPPLVAAPSASPASDSMYASLSGSPAPSPGFCPPDSPGAAATANGANPGASAASSAPSAAGSLLPPSAASAAEAAAAEASLTAAAAARPSAGTEGALAAEGFAETGDASASKGRPPPSGLFADDDDEDVFAKKG